MHEPDRRKTIRGDARAYEEALAPQQRKKLGQFFSGLPLGKLLAHLALTSDTHTVLDPMAGHGDLLDAIWESSTERGFRLDRLDGIEIDEMTAVTCRSRLAQITSGTRQPAQQIIAADAFDLASVEALAMRAYDLVITNPPYVRYQECNTNGTKSQRIRAGLTSIIDSHLFASDRSVWRELAESYSGLADLSVPAWILAATMVRPGGRLALVVPATWRSRDYADIIRYLLLRCFSLECIVEDKQPGWFSDALVRTHLIVARRLQTQETVRALGSREKWPSTLWLQVAPEAAGRSSLVGNAFEGDQPEAQFAAWVRAECKTSPKGIAARRFDLSQEWDSLAARIKQRRWYHRLEGTGNDLPLFGCVPRSKPTIIPGALGEILPEGIAADALCTLERAGIQVGQGLRTGCNRFFYVTACGPSENDMVSVEASSFFQHRRFSVPADALRPVLRRQSEMKAVEEGREPDGRLLDLRRWVLPEDSEIVAKAKTAYAAHGETQPKIMPDELACYVRMASTTNLEDAGEAKRIPQLSAVCTNVRMSTNGQVIPRFWYMVPNFAPRHLPTAFVARINHGLAWVERNCDPPILIDANFSTFWSPQGKWTRHALKALLNSGWCRICMEALGTPMGGGALKLEATHLRHMPVPLLSSAAKEALDAVGKELVRDARNVLSVIDEIILNAIFCRSSHNASLSRLAKSVTDRAYSLWEARQRRA